MGFVSFCEAFGCAVLKDAAGMWPKLLAAHIGERLLRIGRAAGSDALTYARTEKGLWPLLVKPALSSSPSSFAQVPEIHLTAARMGLVPPWACL